jgi:nicotinamidase-related amidase
LENLRFGPLTDRTVHLCVDVQNLFALGTPSHTPWMARVLPVITRIAQEHPRKTVFTRFIPSEQPDQMPGTWQRYYEHWRDLTLERMDPQLLELVPPLATLTPPARNSREAVLLTRSQNHDCRICCVDAGPMPHHPGAVLDFVDLGYRVVLVTDSLCSSSDATHDALLILYRDRFSQQIETITGGALLTCWNWGESVGSRPGGHAAESKGFASAAPSGPV